MNLFFDRTYVYCLRRIVLKLKLKFMHRVLVFLKFLILSSPLIIRVSAVVKYLRLDILVHLLNHLLVVGRAHIKIRVVLERLVVTQNLHLVLVVSL